jgi:hypothetical protein
MSSLPPTKPENAISAEQLFVTDKEQAQQILDKAYARYGYVFNVDQAQKLVR